MKPNSNLISLLCLMNIVSLIGCHDLPVPVEPFLTNPKTSYDNFSELNWWESSFRIYANYVLKIKNIYTILKTYLILENFIRKETNLLIQNYSKLKTIKSVFNYTISLKFVCFQPSSEFFDKFSSTATV